MSMHSKSNIATTALLKAIECYRESDWISSTILAGAAQQVLRDLCVARGVETTIEKLSALLGHEKSDVHNLIASSYNGMKHADRDPEKNIYVTSTEPRVLIIMAAADLARLNFKYSNKIGEILYFARSFRDRKTS